MWGHSLQQLYEQVSNLIGCTASTAEGDRIVQAFRTAQPKDRCRLYRLLEGHMWQGDFKSGWFDKRGWFDRDGLYISLNEDQRTELRKILNESWYDDQDWY